jgi:hypothetical protein
MGVAMDTKEWYRRQLERPEWKEKRAEIYERDRRTCVDCSKTGVKIHCHHEHYVTGKKPWEYPAYALVTLCAACHEKRHKKLIPKFASHEEAEMWILFAEIEEEKLRWELEKRADRIDELVRRGATWDSENRYYALADRKGKERFYDEEGNEL